LQGINGSRTKTVVKNSGKIRESKYSIFRHNRINGTRVWHIHGECNVPGSITLGYEHYSGQLQQMRNYVVSGTNYRKKSNQKPLSSRIKTNEIFHESWIDLFFTRDIHIIGLALDFVETDIWWLLTYRARLLKNKRHKIANKIYYYIPEKYVENSKHKIELLNSVKISIVPNQKKGEPYYREIIESVAKKR
jgi:hypothetical protein